jgi:hypothetical protein
MAPMGCGYGSEFHLLRYLGYHRRRLDDEIGKQIGGSVTEWLDFQFNIAQKLPKTDEKRPKLDCEWRGVDFLPNLERVWSAYWPQSGNIPNWDAVGRSSSEGEYLLVEAKAHTGEIRSDCGAKDAQGRGGLGKIKTALGDTIDAYGFESTPDDWLKGYYQYANRLACLHFLRQNSIPARLVFIYFVGDKWGGGKIGGKFPNCPKTAGDWDKHLHAMYKHLGLNGASELEKHVHKVFLPVAG